MIQNDFNLPEPPLEPPEEKIPHCPVCGEECDILYRQYGDIIGCDACIIEIDAWDRRDYETV